MRPCPKEDRRLRARPVKFVKAIVSACDGSGAAALLVTVKRGSRY